jgi:hypothetical protein
MSTVSPLLGPLPPTTAQAWAAAELGQAALGDPRRTRRLVQLTAAVAAQPQASLAQACGDAASTKAAYRFFAGAETSFHDHPAAIRAAHCHATQARVAAQPVVRAVQDTTSLNFTGHVVADVGALDRPGQYGLFVHSTLAVLPDDGVPQGLLAQEVWARPAAPPGGRRPRRARPVAAKESQKWLTALAASRTAVPPGVTLVHVGDREADVYDLFLAQAAQPGTELLIRAAQDRRVQAPTGTLWAALDAQPIADIRRVELPQANDRPARAVELSLRWTRVTLRPPKARAAEHLPALPVDALLVRDEVPTPGAAPIEWLLLTTVPVDSVADAWERVRWYTYRWLVERYHYVLQSGCRIEQRHLETATRLECCLAIYAVVACWLLRLVYSARATPAAPATTLLAPVEWAVLWAARHPTQPVPAAPTLRELVREIAGLGGFLGRRRDGEPGVKTVWQGLQRLHDVLIGYHLARPLSQLVGNP